MEVKREEKKVMNRDEKAGERGDLEKDRKMFSRRKNCWFCAKKVEPDWKDASTFSWLSNEFGKISPRRITGVCAKHQRVVTVSVKRARQMGIVSSLSGQVIQ